VIVPEDKSLDSTLALLRDGYEFIGRRCALYNSDVFRSRIMLRAVICMRGPAAARLFYCDDKLTRVGSMPTTVLRLLQDKGSVQQLDGEEHHHRKAMFIRMLMQTDGVAKLTALFNKVWRARIETWVSKSKIELMQECNLILTRAACEWTGVPLVEDEDDALARQLSSMIENTGHFGPSMWAALLRRNGTERRLAQHLTDVRNGSLVVSPDQPLAIIASHRNEDGQLLAIKAAVVELINILRPIVAIGRFIVFAALELQRNEEWCRMFKGGKTTLLGDFVEEVRRISPFFPFVGAIVKEHLDWEGLILPKGQWLLLDLYGTNHDASLFPQPTKFLPTRQLSWTHQGYNFVPQGAGEIATTHRCPGEMITVELMKAAVWLLCNEMRYDVATPDVPVKLNRIPAKPKGGFVIQNVRKRAAG
jgi:fatty-acid peroxygenase